MLVAVVIPLSRVIVGIGINDATLPLVYGHHQFEPDALWSATILIVVFVHIVQTLGRGSPAC